MKERAAGNAGGPDLRSVFGVGVLTAVSRVLGLLREATKAYFLGTALAADAFHIAFMLPSALRSLVAEGAVSSAIVPVFARYVRRGDRGEVRRVAEKYLSLWLVLVLLTTAAGLVVAVEGLGLLSRYGIFAGVERLALTTDLASIVFWYLALIGLAAALQGILHSHGEFWFPALSPVLFNIAFVATVWGIAPFLPESRRVYVFAGAVITGGVLQLAILVPRVWRLGVRPVWRWPLDEPGVRQMLRLLVPATFGAGIYQINVVVNTLLASRLDGDGFVAALSYSNRLMEVVLGVFVFALSTVSLTALSRHAADGDTETYSRTLEQVVQLGLFITIPSAVGLYILRVPVLALLLRSGSFDERSLDLTQAAFQYHVLGLAAVGLSRAFVSGFYALKDVRTPVRIAAVHLVVNLGLAASLSASPMEYTGIALASSLAAVSQVALLAWALRRRVREVRFGRMARTAGRALVGSAAMGTVVAGLGSLLDPGAGKLELAAGVVAAVTAGALVYFAAAKALRMDEVGWVSQGLIRRRAGRPA